MFYDMLLALFWKLKFSNGSSGIFYVAIWKLYREENIYGSSDYNRYRQ